MTKTAVAKTLALSGITAIALTLAVGNAPANAAAAPIAAPVLKAADGTKIEPVDYRRCWWHDGHRHCRWVITDYYDSYYYPGPVLGFAFSGGGRGFGGRGGGRRGGGRHH